jgi:hypothetical protein
VAELLSRNELLNFDRLTNYTSNSISNQDATELLVELNKISSDSLFNFFRRSTKGTFKVLSTDVSVQNKLANYWKNEDKEKWMCAAQKVKDKALERVDVYNNLNEIVKVLKMMHNCLENSVTKFSILLRFGESNWNGFRWNHTYILCA